MLSPTSESAARWNTASNFQAKISASRWRSAPVGLHEGGAGGDGLAVAVERSSTTTTSCPASSSVRTRWLPTPTGSARDKITRHGSPDPMTEDVPEDYGTISLAAGPLRGEEPASRSGRPRRTSRPRARRARSAAPARATARPAAPPWAGALGRGLGGELPDGGRGAHGIQQHRLGGDHLARQQASPLRRQDEDGRSSPARPNSMPACCKAGSKGGGAPSSRPATTAKPPAVPRR